MTAATRQVETNRHRASKGLRTPRLSKRRLDVVPDRSSPCRRSSFAAAVLPYNARHRRRVVVPRETKATWAMRLAEHGRSSPLMTVSQAAITA